MRKKILIIGSIVLTVLIIALFGFFYMTSLPFYNPGMVKSETNLRYPLIPPNQDNSSDFWNVESDIKLYHFSKGSGKNVLIIHGGPGVPFRIPLKGLEKLTDKYKFHYYDQRGCGDSTRPIDKFSSPNMYENMVKLDKTLGLGAQIADIERIRRILGEDKLIIIGHSWGGFLATLYAAEFPEHIQSLVLISPATTLLMPQKEPDIFTGVRNLLPKNELSSYDAFMKDYFNFAKLFTLSDNDLIEMSDQFGKYYVSVMKTPVHAPGRLGGWMVWGMYISMGQRHDYRSALKKITAPALIIYGDKDLMSEKAIKEYASLLPDSKLEVINNATHFAFEEQPEKFAAIVGDFFNSK